MDIFSDLFKGINILSILALADLGLTVKEMASKAADSHKKGLTKYGEYSRMLTGYQKSYRKITKPVIKTGLNLFSYLCWPWVGRFTRLITV